MAGTSPLPPGLFRVGNVQATISAVREEGNKPPVAELAPSSSRNGYDSVFSQRPVAATGSSEVRNEEVEAEEEHSPIWQTDPGWRAVGDNGEAAEREEGGSNEERDGEVGGGAGQRTEGNHENDEEDSLFGGNEKNDEDENENDQWNEEVVEPDSSQCSDERQGQAGAESTNDEWPHDERPTTGGKLIGMTEEERRAALAARYAQMEAVVNATNDPGNWTDPEDVVPPTTGGKTRIRPGEDLPNNALDDVFGSECEEPAERLAPGGPLLPLPYPDDEEGEDEAVEPHGSEIAPAHESEEEDYDPENRPTTSGKVLGLTEEEYRQRIIADAAARACEPAARDEYPERATTGGKTRLLPGPQDDEAAEAPEAPEVPEGEAEPEPAEEPARASESGKRPRPDDAAPEAETAEEREGEEEEEEEGNDRALGRPRFDPNPSSIAYGRPAKKPKTGRLGRMRAEVAAPEPEAPEPESLAYKPKKEGRKAKVAKARAPKKTNNRIRCAHIHTQGKKEGERCGNTFNPLPSGKQYCYKHRDQYGVGGGAGDGGAGDGDAGGAGPAAPSAPPAPVA